MYPDPEKTTHLHFKKRPSEDELAVRMGFGSSSGLAKFFEDDKFFKLVPQRIPIIFCGAWLYFIIVLMFATAWWTQEKMLVGMGVISAILIAPTMLAMLHWINEKNGTEDFISLDKKTGDVSLPRVPVEFTTKQIVEFVAVEFGDEHSQVLVVVDQGVGGFDCWLVTNETPAALFCPIKKFVDNFEVRFRKIGLPGTAGLESAGVQFK